MAVIPTLQDVAAQNHGTVAVPEDFSPDAVIRLIEVGYRVLIVHEITPAYFRVTEHPASVTLNAGKRGGLQ